MKKISSLNFPFHIIFFSIQPILFLYVKNANQLNFEQVAKPIILTFIISSFIAIICKSKLNFTSITSLCIFFFYYQYLIYLKLNAFFTPLKFPINPFLFFICSLLLLFLLIRTIYNKNVNSYFNIYSFFILISTVFYFDTFKKSISNKSETISSSNNLRNSNKDIYYIILDGYPNSTTLKTEYGFDNHLFINYLKNKKFYLVHNSISNYSLTFLSLASSLNWDYVNREIDDVKSIDRTTFYSLIQQNKTFNYLNKKGYTFINLCSGWGPTQFMKSADINISLNNKVNEFTNILLNTTILAYMKSYIPVLYTNTEVIDHSFSTLCKISLINKKKFVLAHILCPHDNFELVEPNDVITPSTFSRKALYIKTIDSLNKKVIATLNSILNQSKEKPIIIVQSDHGTSFGFNEADWANPTDKVLKDRMRNFSAIYFPDIDLADSLMTISPVNNFRLLLNNYFDEKLPILKDTSYFSNYIAPYKFKNVTEIVKFN